MDAPFESDEQAVMPRIEMFVTPFVPEASLDADMDADDQDADDQDTRAVALPSVAPMSLDDRLDGLRAEVAAEVPVLEAEPGRMADDDEVAHLLAPFFHKGFVRRKDAKGLMDPAKRAEAERRLNAVDLSLAFSPYSHYYGLALADGPGGKAERITNLAELDRNALALLTIMWARLVLPQRLAEEGREGGVAEPSVSFDALNAEYGKKLGGRRFEMYVSQLKRLGFLEYTRKDDIKAGPFLDLLGDSNLLASFLRQSTLAKVLADQPAAEAEAEDDADAPATVA